MCLQQQCEKYWHNAHGRYGGVDVWLDDTDCLADFNVRTFRIKKVSLVQGQNGQSFFRNVWTDAFKVCLALSKDFQLHSKVSDCDDQIPWVTTCSQFRISELGSGQHTMANLE